MNVSYEDEEVLNTFQPIGLQAGFLLLELTARRAARTLLN
jgi:hypothetical protein